MNLAVLGEPWLSVSKTVSYVPSVTILDLLLRRRFPVRRVRRFLGVADPDGTLPHAAGEVRAAAAGFADPVVMTGAEIDFPAVLANLIDVDVAHFACHGRHFADFPDLSFLHVSGRGPELAVLFAHEVIRTGAGVRLLVLAACHAGTGAVLPGQEYVGLPGSFLIAGVNAVLAPLWAVDDRGTATLMRHFYAALTTAPDPAAALLHAQQAMRADPDTADPRRWAGFLLIGVP